MKNLTKTILGIAIICFVLMGLSACQEDVYPEFNQNEPGTEKVSDNKGETEDGDEDIGLDPK